MNIFQLLCHKLFGCDYIAIQSGNGFKVVRVHTLPSGVRYVWLYTELHVIPTTGRTYYYLT
jgi:hypothetical protein